MHCGLPIYSIFLSPVLSQTALLWPMKVVRITNKTLEAGLLVRAVAVGWQPVVQEEMVHVTF